MRNLHIGFYPDITVCYGEKEKDKGAGECELVGKPIRGKPATAAMKQVEATIIKVVAKKNKQTNHRWGVSFHELFKSYQFG